MWRRSVSSQLRTLSNFRSAPKPHRFPAGAGVSSSYALSRPTVALFNLHFSTEYGNVSTTKKVVDVMPIATGHEREELEADLAGRNILAVNYPVGPFGTKAVRFLECHSIWMLSFTSEILDWECRS